MFNLEQQTNIYNDLRCLKIIIDNVPSYETQMSILGHTFEIRESPYVDIDFSNKKILYTLQKNNKFKTLSEVYI